MDRTPLRRRIWLMTAALLVAVSSATAEQPMGVEELDATAVEQKSAQASDEESGIIELDANEAEDGAESADAENAKEELMAEITFGEPRDCVNTQRIRSSDVLSDREILFFMNGSDVYLNKLPHRCSGLRRADTFSYEVRGSQLCHIDLIRVVDYFGGSIRPGVACGLGKFLPVDKEQVPLLREQAKARAQAGK